MKDKNKLKTILVLLCIVFTIPSIVHMLTGNRIFDLNSDFNFFYMTSTGLSKAIGTIFFVGIFTAICITYFMIIKYNKEIFKDSKQFIKFILIISIIFLIMLPLTSTDVFYYIGTGWSDAHYKVNPYYTSVKEILSTNTTAQSDEMLLKMRGVWEGQTIVYGPIWPLICKILSWLSFGNLAIALFIYKILNLVLHIVNTKMIYKMTGKKQIFALIYGLNPIILFECLTNVHNEMLVIFFIVAALYFFIVKKKMLPTIIFLALATAVKYYAILLIPFIVLYYYRKEKPLKKILYSAMWAIVFGVVLVGCYLIYTRNLEVLKGILTQQNKFANSFFILIAVRNLELASAISKGCMLGFIVIYCSEIIRLIFTKKQYKFFDYIRKYQWLLIIFIFGTITNFQPWYTLWLLPTICWQSSKSIKNNLIIIMASELANVVYFTFNGSYIYGQYYWALMIGIILVNKIINKKDKIKLGETNVKK